MSTAHSLNSSAIFSGWT